MLRGLRLTSALTLLLAGACEEAPTNEQAPQAVSDEAVPAPQTVEPSIPKSESASRPAATLPLDISDAPLEYGDPELRCYELTAYASPDAKNLPYSVPASPDLYAEFLIRAPWPGTQYIKSMRAVLDDRRIVHHLLLLRQHQSEPERIIPNGTGIHTDGDMLYAWAPGSSDLWLGPDVGMEMAEGTLLMMENHYNNRLGAPAPDKSGVEVCVTPRKPKHLAALSYVGTDLIAGASATGTCTHESREPVHLIMAMPHMHTKGRHMKVEWTRADGRKTSLHDSAFDADYQQQYLYNDVVLQPGDKLTTTCTFSAPSLFGKGTNDEMCIYFSLHYPAGALARRTIFQALHGPNTCID